MEQVPPKSGAEEANLSTRNRTFERGNGGAKNQSVRRENTKQEKKKSPPTEEKNTTAVDEKN